MTHYLKIFLLALFVCCCSKTQTEPLVIVTDNDEVTYQVELAATDEQLRTGLMYRKELPVDRGMIFDLSPYMQYPTKMWMKNTLIPLDMLFLTPEGIIFWIQENAQPYSEDIITAPFPAAAVVELNAGEVSKNHIKVGQIVKHSLFPPLKLKDDSLNQSPSVAK